MYCSKRQNLRRDLTKDLKKVIISYIRLQMRCGLIRARSVFFDRHLIFVRY